MSQVMGGAKGGKKDVLGKRRSTERRRERDRGMFGDLEAVQYVWGRERGERGTA